MSDLVNDHIKTIHVIKNPVTWSLKSIMAAIFSLQNTFSVMARAKYWLEYDYFQTIVNQCLYELRWITLACAATQCCVIKFALSRAFFLAATFCLLGEIKSSISATCHSTLCIANQFFDLAPAEFHWVGCMHRTLQQGSFSWWVLHKTSTSWQKSLAVRYLQLKLG